MPWAGAEALSTRALAPGWRAPAGVGALMSTRAGGASGAPWASLNVGRAVGDTAEAVAENRRRFAAAIGARPVWLRQVHGTQVVRLGGADAGEPAADAAWTREPGVACVVQVADCLPLLLARRDGGAVAAVHAGWRGLAAGVVENALRALCEGSGCAARDLLAWLGPCIGPRRYEVGADVVQAFGDGAGFRACTRSDGSPGWLADLPALAAARLRAAGVVSITVDGACTFDDDERFFSFRRDGRTGRMAAAVWIRAATPSHA